MFIIDANDRLIAAEAADITRWGLNDIYQAAQAFHDGHLSLDLQTGRLGGIPEETVECRIEQMESLLGTWYRCTMAEAEEAAAEEPVPSVERAEDSALLEVPLPTETEEETEVQEEAPPVPAEETPAAEEPLPLLEEEEETPAPSETTEEPPVDEELPVTEESPVDEELEALLKLSEEVEETDTISLLEETTEASEEEEPLSVEEPAAEEESADEELKALLQLSEDEGAPLELLTPEEEEERLEEGMTRPREAEQSAESLLQPGPWKELAENFHPDLPANAQEIELDNKEYGELLQEFIQDSRSMHAQLVEEQNAPRQEAVSILQDAISLLHLSPLDQLLGMLEQATYEERLEIVDTYERLLDQLERNLLTLKKTGIPSSIQEQPAPSPLTPEPTAPERETPSVAEKEAERPLPGETAVPPVSEERETPEKPEEKLPTEKTKEEGETVPATAIQSVEEFLEGVRPIPIEFSLHIAAEELNLPEDLVLEFIGDFDKQGHEYLPVLIEAYQNRDLDRLQKTAHMLKGAASNLRIEAMVDNLYDLQFDTDIDRAPQRIRLFAGQLMSLDKYLEQMNK